MIRNFNEYAIKNNEPHPIANLFYEAMLAVEKLGASEKQTDAIIKLGACKDAVEDLLFRNNVYKSGRVDVLLDGYIQSKDSPKAFIKGGDEVTLVKIKSKQNNTMKQSKNIAKNVTGEYVIIVNDNPKINIQPIKLLHHKNEVIRYEGRLYRCICCDHEFAIYSTIIRKKSGEWRTQLSKSFVTNNSESKLFEYKLHHDDFWAMVDQEQKEADSKI